MWGEDCDGSLYFGGSAFGIASSSAASGKFKKRPKQRQHVEDPQAFNSACADNVDRANRATHALIPALPHLTSRNSSITGINSAMF